MPLYKPLQVQFHGPEPVTVDAAPAVQRLVDGAEINVVLFEPPQEPLTGGMRLNVALTLVEVDMVTMHVLPVPVHALDQPVNDEPGSGVTVSVTTEPVG